MNTHTASHLDRIQTHIDSIIIPNNTSATQNVKHNHDDVLSGGHVNDTAPATMMATLQDQAYALVEGPAEILRKDLIVDSHELALEVPQVRGAVQTEHTSSNNTELVRDIGWHKANVEIPDPLINGYTNGELFSFIRRFNKVELPQSDYAICRTNF